MTDGDEWKASRSFGRDDLALLAKVGDRAHTWILQQDQNGNGGRRNEKEIPY
jgi:hypothetical protein